MPTYQYECDACGQPLEVVQSFSDDALTICPSCNEPKLRKVYGSVGVVFKGSGFYRTDSRGSSSSTTADSKTSDSTKSTTAAPAASATPAPAKAAPATSTASTSSN